MLSSSQRLSVEQFDVVIKKGRVFHSSLFLIQYVVGTPDIRIAASVPKKVCKKAIDRNKIRRKIYESVRSLKKDIVQNTHMIIFAKNTVKNTKHSDWAPDIKNLFVKASFLR